ncbi:hypothetical protein NC797_12785 [Aquibacillus sp. 3ASR75-11]|uniref:Uncharacterized protein n=1 Tax=Terrihalobacillus insolitus TaxID=2950438 RepID=A0A9X3WW98_9BACI|nr:hypothetical protein [Terrihalobacillus insolitus]MDC3414170.1 hypothetical protein [Terrihalobacillus insolitus]MDC3425376.1 hypothetical protein [Terrihalobacillus insolitus]
MKSKLKMLNSKTTKGWKIGLGSAALIGSMVAGPLGTSAAETNPGFEVSSQTTNAQVSQLDVIKRELRKYTSVKAAEKAGYTKLTDFVPQMGYHYTNTAAVGTDLPNILLYAPVNGVLTLVGAEWGTADPNAESPIDGTNFNLVHKASAHYTDGSEMEWADPTTVPQTNPDTGATLDQWHPDLYGMHVWFLDNPNGTFADMNPALNNVIGHEDLRP